MTAARLDRLAKGKGGLWRSVIAGQKSACIAGRGTSTTEAGRAAERRAWWFYRVRGYRILDTNVWLGGNELDLVVRRGRRLAFVEVKAKSGGRHGDPFDMVGPEKQRRIRRAAEAWLAANPELASLDVTFDVVALRNGKLERLAKAF